MSTFSSRWSVTIEDSTATVSAGADETHLLRDLNEESVRYLQACVAGDSVTATVGTEAAEVERFLQTVGALPAVDPPLPVQVVAVGEHEIDLNELVSPRPMTVVVRTGGRLTDLVDAVDSLDGPALLVDAVAHHTISIGPFAVPGRTACIGCYATRVRLRWGDPSVPHEPAVLSAMPVITSLLEIQLGLVADGASPLLNNTITWNLQTGVSERHSLLRAPDCPVCRPAMPSGRLQKVELSA